MELECFPGSFRKVYSSLRDIYYLYGGASSRISAGKAFTVYVELLAIVLPFLENNRESIAAATFNQTRTRNISI